MPIVQSGARLITMTFNYEYNQANANNWVRIETHVADPLPITLTVDNNGGRINPPNMNYIYDMFLTCVRNC